MSGRGRNRDRKVLEVILKLTPELLIEKDYSKWCKALYPTSNHWCFRKKGHKGLHATGRGCELRSSVSSNVIIARPLTHIRIWK